MSEMKGENFRGSKKIEFLFHNALVAHTGLCNALDRLCEAALGKSFQESGLLHFIVPNVADEMHRRGLTDEQINKVADVFSEALELVNEDFMDSAPEEPYTKEEMQEFVRWTKELKGAHKHIDLNTYTRMEEKVRELARAIAAGSPEDETNLAADVSKERRDDYIEETLTYLIDPFEDLFPEAVQRVRAGEVEQGVSDIRAGLDKLTLEPKERQVIIGALDRLVEVFTKDELRRPKTVGDIQHEAAKSARFLGDLEKAVRAVGERMADAEAEVVEKREKGRLAAVKAWLRKKAEQ